MNTSTYKSELFGKITLGADPEVLLVTAADIPWGGYKCSTGTKEDPEVVPYGAIQVDGMALEYNIDPASCLKEWKENHYCVLDVLKDRAGREDLSLTDISCQQYDYYIDIVACEEELMFGCEPDLNAGTGVENEMPENDGSIKFRTAGGHVHVGFSEWSTNSGNSLETARTLVKLMDATLGLWSIFTDEGQERRKLYGNAGAFRLKDYGFEYRTLSNFWVFDEAYLQYVYNTTVSLFSLPTNKMFNLVSQVQELYPQIEKAINNNLIDDAIILHAKVEAMINA